ncbi:MAG: leucyl/phenylalanyl-tRNA--protein transferase [Polynucleobacter sp.]|nr:leucyl/phenylalanyl-tRNA--protein transferase [Polynucleobacter sp.]MDZ4056879.1 leucyl/phenylalanyl-tRNA--protein transferase [Polynucleobacter sp.]
MSQIGWLGPDNAFPDPAITPDPDPEVAGLFAVSERIYPGQLEAAYRLGLFPWYSDHQPVLWWSPNPRMVLEPKQFKVSRSFQKTIRHFCNDPSAQIEVDVDFGLVMRACALSARKDQNGTWITHEIMAAYTDLHEKGCAHSIAVMQNGALIGGLYCVALGSMVFGESMFSRQADASKLALASLCAWCYDHAVPIIDCQQETAHLRSLGANPIARNHFLSIAREALTKNTLPVSWQFNKTLLERWQ